MATPAVVKERTVKKSFYPRHPRGWRRVGAGVYHQAGFVSIHATLAGGDDKWRAKLYSLVTFLSTPPSRVATGPGRKDSARDRGFYPRHPRGWRQHARDRVFHRQFVSIHATLAGGDVVSWFVALSTSWFLSTPPSRVATAGTQQTIDMLTKFLSTPPSRVATGFPQPPSASGLSFYPRHPRGWRRHGAGRTVDGAGFLSTPPSRVATADAKKVIDEGVFLSTPPSRMATVSTLLFTRSITCFYPRHPRGWRRNHKKLANLTGMFLSTPPSRVATSEKKTM